MTPEEQKQSFEREALELYPDADEKYSKVHRDHYNAFARMEREAHVKARMQSSQELSDLHEQLAEAQRRNEISKTSTILSLRFESLRLIKDRD